MKLFFCVAFTLFSSALFSQQDSLSVLPINGNNPQISYDTLSQNQAKLQLFDVLEKGKPQVFADLQKTALSRKHFDSIWLKQQYKSDYYALQNVIERKDFEDVITDLHTDTLKVRLAALDARTPFKVEYNPELERIIKTFLTKKTDFLERMLTRSQFYFPLFEQQLDNYDIPLEMKYLAIVESALNPRARSRVGATGLWQFMYPTGKQFNLNVSSYVDERRDPIKATEAACKYLKSLHKTFDDWDLALAAYNSGPGNVSRAIRRSGGRQNYWNLRGYLPRETAGYVPAFLTMMYIFEYADAHNLHPQKIDTPYFETDTVHIKQLITFKQIEKATSISLEELQFFNPSYKLDIIPHIKGRDYYVRLPRYALGDFVEREDSIYALAKTENAAREKPLPKLQTLNQRIRYKVKNGDYLGKIANKYGVRISDIKRWNSLKSNNLTIGQRLTIYPRKPGFTAVSKSPTKSKVAYNKSTYIVKAGDSLWVISRKFPGVSVRNIQEWNDISGSELQPGMKLKISKG